MRAFTFTILFVFFTLNFLLGQSTSDSLSQVRTPSDSTIVTDDPYGVFDMFKGNPGKAALYSLVIPGAGQLYNKQYWKIPVVWAAEGAAIYNLIDKWKEYDKWNSDWEKLVNNDFDTCTTLTDVNAVFQRKNDRRADRDQAWLIVIGVHLIATADAFVSRHLIEFDVDDDITFKFDPISPYPGINLAITF